MDSRFNIIGAYFNPLNVNAKQENPFSVGVYTFLDSESNKKIFQRIKYMPFARKERMLEMATNMSPAKNVNSPLISSLT